AGAAQSSCWGPQVVLQPERCSVGRVHVAHIMTPLPNPPIFQLHK
ncbi:hypothetical protein A2U01_0074625, partial [Trifolium medium]|nr:hypothetical protein [Trifolium medium]